MTASPPSSATAPAGIGALIPRLAPGVSADAGPVGSGCLRLRSAPRPRGWLGRRLGLAESIAVELDDLGAFVVQRLDGRPLDELAAAVAEHLRLTRREAETCTADFLRQLIDRRLVVVERPADSACQRYAPPMVGPSALPAPQPAVAGSDLYPGAARVAPSGAPPFPVSASA